MDKDLIKKALTQLPPNLKDYLDKDDWSVIVGKIGQHYGLRPEQVSELEDQTLVVLLGVQASDNYENKLKTEVDLDPDRARQVAQMIQGEIFSKYLNDINAAFAANGKLQEEATKAEVYELGEMPAEYQNKFDQLPDDVKQAISSNDSANKIRVIAQKNKLHVDQTGRLGTQVGLVMLGVLPPRDFVAALGKELAITPEVARTVATDVNEQIFTPIRESLKKIHHLDFSGESGSPTSKGKSDFQTPPIPVPPSPPLRQGFAEQAPPPLRQDSAGQAPSQNTFAAKVSAPAVASKQESVLTPADLANKPKKDVDPYREPVE